VIPGTLLNANNIMLNIYISIGCITVRGVTAKISPYGGLYKNPRGGVREQVKSDRNSEEKTTPF